jgi:hypothetical protein
LLAASEVIQAVPGGTEVDYAAIKTMCPTDLSGYLKFEATTELTISSEDLTITKTAHKLHPQSGTTDNLSTINGTADGDFGILSVSDLGTDTITIKHNVGSILCASGADINLRNGAIAWFLDRTKAFVIGDGSGIGTGTSTIYPRFVHVFVLTGNPNPTSEKSAKTSIFIIPHGSENTFQPWDGSKFMLKEFAKKTG